MVAKTKGKAKGRAKKASSKKAKKKRELGYVWQALRGELPPGLMNAYTKVPKPGYHQTVRTSKDGTKSFIVFRPGPQTAAEAAIRERFRGMPAAPGNVLRADAGLGSRKRMNVME